MRKKKSPAPNVDTPLLLDFCGIKAARFAVLNWHYSRSMPAGKMVRVGVWEQGKFVGVIIFSRGANKAIGSPYKLQQTEVCELTRVALCNHQTPVSQLVSIAIKMLKKTNAGLRLIVSYADLDQNHQGIIYRAGNWIYEGLKNQGVMGAFIIHGKKVHPKSIHSKYGTGSQSLPWLRKYVDPNASVFITKGKHKYLMPLDDDMRAKIKPLAKPYSASVV